MTFRVTKLKIGKGKTTGDEKEQEWNREYYEVEADVLSEKDIEVAKASLEGLLDVWVRGETVTPKESTWSADKIKWEDAEGSSGPYKRSEDVDNPEFKTMLKDLSSHQGKLSRKESDGTWFYWTFSNGTTVGRKKRK